MINWIDVKDWLPGDCVNVLICYHSINDLPYINMAVGYYNFDSESWSITEPLEEDLLKDDADKITVIAWTLLPEPPSLKICKCSNQR
jgi:hypothetical protein